MHVKSVLQHYLKALLSDQMYYNDDFLLVSCVFIYDACNYVYLKYNNTCHSTCFTTDHNHQMLNISFMLIQLICKSKVPSVLFSNLCCYTNQVLFFQENKIMPIISLQNYKRKASYDICLTNNKHIKISKLALQSCGSSFGEFSKVSNITQNCFYAKLLPSN